MLKDEIKLQLDEIEDGDLVIIVYNTGRVEPHTIDMSRQFLSHKLEVECMLYALEAAELPKVEKIRDYPVIVRSPSTMERVLYG